ncbi:MAG TPA: hypothetical protein VEF04_07250, partial [Blastocatellia bacterium]|nr:hypothetical protein [Blastocatellia bacterium]
MHIKKISAIFLTLCFFVFTVAAQDQAQPPKTETITIGPKLVISKLKVGEGEAYEVRGKASFTFTGANSDDSIAGVLTYALPEDARAKIAQ